MIVELIDARESDFVRQQLLIAPVLLQQASPLIKVLAPNRGQNSTAKILDCVKAIRDPAVIGLLAALHCAILNRQNLERIALNPRVVDVSIGDQRGQRTAS